MVIIPLTMLVEYTEYDIKFDFLCKLYHFLITSKIPMSAFIMVAIAFDRYFCICHPFSRIITQKRARYIVICLALLAVFFGVLTSLFYGVYQVIDWIDSKRIDEAMGTNFTQSVAKVDEINKMTLIDRSQQYNDLRLRLIETIRARNFTFNGTSRDYLPTISEIVYVGVCSPSNMIFGETLFHLYQRTYMAVYPICLITVMILYFMIYRFMCLRRSKKLQQKLIMCSYINGDGTYENTRLVSGDADETRRSSKAGKSPTSDTARLPAPAPGADCVSRAGIRAPASRERKNESQVTVKYGNNLLVETTPSGKIAVSPTVTTSAVTPTDNDDNMPILSFYNNNASINNNSNNNTTQAASGRRHSHMPSQKYQWHKNRDSVKRYKGKTRRRKSQHSYDADRLREENRSANVRTALMLFTVTLVFMIAFVPAWIMAHRLIEHYPTVFYLYFSYNVANPFIYAFMNHIFKDYMRKMFTCRQLSSPQRQDS